MIHGLPGTAKKFHYKNDIFRFYLSFCCTVKNYYQLNSNLNTFKFKHQPNLWIQNLTIPNSIQCYKTLPNWSWLNDNLTPLKKNSKNTNLNLANTLKDAAKIQECAMKPKITFITQIMKILILSYLT
jgi:hypothetical protein